MSLRPRLRRLAASVVVAACALGAALGAPADDGRPAAASAQEADEALLERVLASLTIDERVGQLVMVNFVGDDVSAESDIASLIRDFKVGSVLITASNGNIVNRNDTAAQLAALTNGLQERAFEATRRADATGEVFVPLLIATDNEGDLFPFTNVTNGYTSIPNNMTIGATWSKEHAQVTGEIVGRELSAAGVNVLLGPVVDVLDQPRSGGRGDIGIRSFGGDAAWVGELGRAFVRGVHEGSGGRMLTVAKHFPGHGGSDRSTDSEVPVVNKTLDQLRASELAPFARVDAAGEDDVAGMTDAMMVSHIRYRNFLQGGGEPFTRPISLDAAAMRALMDLPEFATWRREHVVMADALGVPAVKKWYAEQEGQASFPNRTVVRDALLAGSDLLPLIEFYPDPAQPGWRDNQLPTIQDSILYMREQYVSDPSFRRRADDAVRRVLASKLRLYPSLRIDEVLVDPAQASAAAGAGAEAMLRLNEDAVTLLQPASVSELRARLPRGPVTPDKIAIVECWADCYPYRIKPELDLQDELLRLYGPAGSGRVRPEDVTTISFGELDAWIADPGGEAHIETAAAISEATWVIFALAEYNPDARPASGAVKRFLASAPVDVRNKHLIAIAYNVPYHLDSTEISKLSAYFVVYNKTQAAIQSGFRALFGDIAPRGRPPVDVSGVFYDVGDAVRPDPSHTLVVRLFGEDVPADARAVGLVTGPVRDRNGNAVVDGTPVTFTLTKEGGSSITTSARTVDGIAGAELRIDGRGTYSATASVTGTAITSEALAIEVGAGGVQPQPETSGDGGGGGDGIGVIALALAIGIPAALAVAAGIAIGVRMRGRSPQPALALATTPEGASAVIAVPEPGPSALPRVRIDPDTRRVYVNGVEATPPLSSEQYRLLAYLYERAGKVVGREELVQRVWPDAHAEGVSEEALDALVRRVRERIVQAGGERGYIVTLRGQGFRLEA
jgi:beta-N-acetylhexosaminidase